MQMECRIADQPLMMGVLEFTSDFETIESLSRLSTDDRGLFDAIAALAPRGYTLSFGGPREDVTVLDSRLLSDILQFCTKAEVHSGDFKYVYQIASRLIASRDAPLEVDFSYNETVNVGLVSRIAVSLPVSRLSLKGCRSLSGRDARDLLRHLSARESPAVLTVDIRDTPAARDVKNEMRRLESLASRSRVSLQIH